MARRAWLPMVWAVATGCFAPAFNPDGKTCTPPEACPSGYTCLPRPDGGVCTANDVVSSYVHECDSPAADWEFCSGFEEGSYAVWDDLDGNPPPYNTLLGDPGPFNFPGNHVSRLFNPPGPGHADLVKVVSGSDTLYARWYFQFEPGYDFSAFEHGSGLYAGGHNAVGNSFHPDGTDFFSVQFGNQSEQWGLHAYYPGMYQQCLPDAGVNCTPDAFPCVADQGQTICTRPQDRPRAAFPSLETQRWYCIELQLSAGAPTSSAAGADGGLDFWVDGEEAGPWTGLWQRSTAALQPDALWLVLSHPDDAGTRWDNVVISRSRVGCR